MEERAPYNIWKLNAEEAWEEGFKTGQERESNHREGENQCVSHDCRSKIFCSKCADDIKKEEWEAGYQSAIKNEKLHPHKLKICIASAMKARQDALEEVEKKFICNRSQPHICEKHPEDCRFEIWTEDWEALKKRGGK